MRLNAVNQLGRMHHIGDRRSPKCQDRNRDGVLFLRDLVRDGERHLLPLVQRGRAVRIEHLVRPFQVMVDALLREINRRFQVIRNQQDLLLQFLFDRRVNLAFEDLIAQRPERHDRNRDEEHADRD